MTAGGCEAQLEVHTNGALNVGVPPEQVVETLIQCIPYTVFSKVLDAVSVAKKVFVERKITLNKHDWRGLNMKIKMTGFFLLLVLFLPMTVRAENIKKSHLYIHGTIGTPPDSGRVEPELEEIIVPVPEKPAIPQTPNGQLPKMGDTQSVISYLFMMTGASLLLITLMLYNQRK